MSPKEIVLAFIDALNREDFDLVRKHLDDNVVFEGVLGHRNGADSYVNDMKTMKFKYKIEKAFSDENDVCLLYNIDMSGKTIFTCGWYQVQRDKIKSIRVVFDPRPLLEQ